MNIELIVNLLVCKLHSAQQFLKLNIRILKAAGWAEIWYMSPVNVKILWAGIKIENIHENWLDNGLVVSHIILLLYPVFSYLRWIVEFKKWEIYLNETDCW